MVKSGNCAKEAGISVKTVFDGRQTGRQAFLKLISRQYRLEMAGRNGIDKNIDEKEQIIDKPQHRHYTVTSENNIAGGDRCGSAEKRRKTL